MKLSIAEVQIKFKPLKLVDPEPESKWLRKVQEVEARKIVRAAENLLIYGEDNEG